MEEETKIEGEEVEIVVEKEEEVMPEGVEEVVE